MCSCNTFMCCSTCNGFPLQMQHMNHLQHLQRMSISCNMSQVMQHMNVFHQHMNVLISTYECECVAISIICDMSHPCVRQSTAWCRVRGCLIFTGHSPQKSRILSGSFAKNDLQLKASYESSPPCTLTASSASIFKKRDQKRDQKASTCLLVNFRKASL